MPPLSFVPTDPTERDERCRELFTIEATLELPGRAPEKLPPVAAMVAPADAEKVRVGYRVSVRVAPDNHQLVDFGW